MFRKSQVYYLIDERDDAVCYVGTTCRELRRRFSEHKSMSMSWEMGQWIHKHKVKIVHAAYGNQFEERKHILDLLAKGNMLFNRASPPNLTAKQRRTFKADHVQWKRDRHADVLPRFDINENV